MALQQPPVSDPNISSLNWIGWFLKLWKYVNALGAAAVSGAPTGATYVTLSNDATLAAERVLTAGANITITDGGANSTVTIAATSGGNVIDDPGFWAMNV